MKTTSIPLKPYSLTELSKLYSVCIKTIKKWMKPFSEEIGEKNGRFYTINQVKVIFSKIGLPGEISNDWSLFAPNRLCLSQSCTKLPKAWNDLFNPSHICFIKINNNHGNKINHQRKLQQQHLFDRCHILSQFRFCRACRLCDQSSSRWSNMARL